MVFNSLCILAFLISFYGMIKVKREGNKFATWISALAVVGLGSALTIMMYLYLIGDKITP